MLNSFLAIAFCFILLIACAGCLQLADRSSQTTTTNVESFSTEAEEYAVYSVVLKELYVRDGANRVIIGEVTSLDWLPETIQREDLEVMRKATRNVIAQDVIYSFQARNVHPHLLENRFDLNITCVLLSKEEVNAIGRPKDGWDSFLAKYPYQSLISLSRIGFNCEMDQALVYTGRECGGKSGGGEYVFLIKEKNVWIIKRRVVSWVS